MSFFVYVCAAIATLVAAQRITRFGRRVALGLMLLPLLFTGRALWSGGVYGPVDLAYTAEPLASIATASGARAVVNPTISDVYTEFMPWHDALRRSIARREWPHWNPYALCGTPLAGAVQSAPYHPITIIGLLVPLHQFFAFAAAMMMLLAALSAFLFFRELVEAEMAALFAAAAWMCSTHLVFFAGTALSFAVSILPLVLLGARRIVRNPGVASAAILSVALVLVILAGHPESVLHVVVLATAYFLFELAGSWPHPALHRVIASGLAAGIVALLLTAAFLLPLFEVISQTEEYTHRSTVYRQGGTTARQVVHRLAASFFPFVEGAGGLEEPVHADAVKHGWLPVAYAGSMIFAPVAFALVRTRRRERWFFLGAIVVGLAVAVQAPGFTHLLSYLPGFSISVNDRMVVYAVLGLCALAAIALDSIDRHLTIFFIAAAAVVASATFLPTDLPADFVRVGATRAVLPLLLAAFAVWVLPRERSAICLVALLLVQRGGENGALQPTLPARAFYPPFPGLATMKANVPFRIAGVGEMLPPELSTHYGLEDVRGFEATTFERLHSTYRLWCTGQPVWSNRVDRLDAPFLSLMNTRFAIVPPAMKLPDGWTMREKFPDYAIAENLKVLPRAFVPRNVRVLQTREASLEAISAIRDFGEQGIVEDSSATTFTPNGPGVGNVTGDGSRLRIRASMTGAGWVVISSANWKGWRAYEGSREIPVRFANHAFIALFLEKGEHSVRLTFRPRSFVIGAWISGVTALLLLAYALIPSSAMTFFMSFQTSFFAEGVRRRYAG